MHAAPGVRGLIQLPLAALLMICGTAAGGAVELDRGARLAAICASCHDGDGKNHGVPPIAGLDAKAIAEAMARYRASEEPSIVMHAIALSLTEEDVASVARYLANKGKEAAP